MSYVIPLLAGPQTLKVDLNGALVTLRLVYADAADGEGGWVLDIVDTFSGVRLLAGIPLVTGADLLEQYAYVGLGIRLFVFTAGDVVAVPTFAGLGTTSKLIWELAD